jgi:hypothetical protein
MNGRARNLKILKYEKDQTILYQSYEEKKKIEKELMEQVLYEKRKALSKELMESRISNQKRSS